jgi:type IV pilus assembly protein PilE
VSNKIFGFSLLELIIVLVLISLLASIGISQYQTSIQKIRRSDAQTTLLDYHARLQRCFVMSHDYQDCVENMHFPQMSLNGFYEIQAINFTGKNYTLQAVAKNIQEKDTACYRFTINQLQEILAYNQNDQLNLVCWTQ